jgi:hypothetical protein
MYKDLQAQLHFSRDSTWFNRPVPSRDVSLGRQRPLHQIVIICLSLALFTVTIEPVNLLRHVCGTPKDPNANPILGTQLYGTGLISAAHMILCLRLSKQ